MARRPAAGGYITYDADTERFSLTEEQAFALAAPDGMQIAAAFHIPNAAAKNTERITEAIRSNSGFGWHEHDPGLFEGTERFSDPGTSRTWRLRGSQPWMALRRSSAMVPRSPT